MALLMQAAEKGDVRALREYFETVPAEKLDLNTVDSGKNTALHLAAYRGHSQVVTLLLSCGCDQVVFGLVFCSARSADMSSHILVLERGE